MFLKIKKNHTGGNGPESSQTYQCSHIQVTHLLDGKGVLIELAPSGQRFTLPDHGDVAYAMNDKGDTIDTYQWPPRPPKEKEFRA